MKNVYMIVIMVLCIVFTGCGPAEAILGPQLQIDLDDRDGDGSSPPADCDDTNSSVSPSAPELLDDLDNDCDGSVDEIEETDTDTDADTDTDTDTDLPDPLTTDDDLDGFCEDTEVCSDGSQPGDCDDADPDRNPGEPELCDGFDQDCDLVIDDNVTYSNYCADDDLDGFGDPGAVQNACSPPPGYVLDCGDCNDGDPSVSPTEIEICDGLDQDCDLVPDNGLVFTDYCPDDDGDGFGDPDGLVSACQMPVDYLLDCQDCDDGNDDTYPGTAPNESDPNGCYKDDDEDDWGDSYDPTTPDGVTLGSDCHDGDDTIQPGAVEIAYDGVDQDCFDGDMCDIDADGSDSTNCGGGDDCDDTDSNVGPSEVEITYNGIDDDCDPGTADEPYLDPLCVIVDASVTGNVDVYVFETNYDNSTYWVDSMSVPVVPNSVPFASGDASGPICGEMDRVPYTTGHSLLVLGIWNDGVEHSLVTGNSMVGYASDVQDITLSGVPLVCFSYTDVMVVPAGYAYSNCTLP